MTENEIRGLCLKSREIFLSQPILLELEAPLKICGKGWLGAAPAGHPGHGLAEPPGWAQGPAGGPSTAPCFPGEVDGWHRDPLRGDVGGCGELGSHTPPVPPHPRRHPRAVL